MSLQEPTGTFGVLFPAFSLPMKAERSRNKERLEASLAGLCELELLKQRQECRVLSALCLGDSPAPGRPAWGALRPVRCATDAPNGGASDDYGDCGLRLQTSSLQCTPWGIMASLEQQVAELKVNTEAKSADLPADLEVSQQSSGDTLVANQDGSSESGYQPMASRSFPAACSKGTVETETGETWVFDPKRGAEAEDILGEMKDVDPTVEDYQQAQRAETYMFGLIQRRALPPRPSKPRTSLAHDARAITVARQSSLCRKEDQHSPKQVSVQGITELPISPQSLEGPPPQACHSLDQERYLGTVFIEDSPPPYHHLQQSTQHQSGLYHRPRQPCLVNNPRSTSVDYPSCRVLQAHPDSSNSEPDSPQHFHSYPSPPPLSMSHQLPPPDEQLVNAEYIPAHPCRASTRTSSHHQSSSMRGSGGPKPSRSTYSPESGHQHQEQQTAVPQIQHSRSRGGPKKCRLNEERGGASRKPGKKACRSQSENSLQRVPERKYNTVERDGGGSGSGGGGSRSSQSRAKKQQQGSGGYRRWRSTQELSQDEGDQPPTQAPVPPPAASNQRDHCARRTRKSRPTHTSYAYLHHNHHHSHHHQHIEYQLERDQVPLCQPSEDYPHPGQGESESSMSEADSPDTSSLSSDSDESGGLVWPQQLPPQLSLPSPPAPPGAPLQPKAFVKIKASHALKKKILRFRTGSLKVMTTV
ncbi:dapper 1-like [Myripristis murdjan]|uniref:dapper 1-like n=1 Tax=Myripristis murdjan TaxID=586833 RepID=UPI001175FCED|nr:dapper 1-like [Myripristis murdjan]